ncbi:hypothetical protein ABZ642_14785 [Streptomyces sp. NPDC007157]|uniref:hypothetical protein n=1 Tax=Streptomyces sp. NPDC007157 TaxID=3154681 RepID=UPI00340900FF
MGDHEQLAWRVGELLTAGQRETLDFGIRYERMTVGCWEWVRARDERTTER